MADLTREQLIAGIRRSQELGDRQLMLELGRRLLAMGESETARTSRPSSTVETDPDGRMWPPTEGEITAAPDESLLSRVTKKPEGETAPADYSGISLADIIMGRGAGRGSIYQNAPSSGAQLVADTVAPIVDAGRSVAAGEPVGTIEGMRLAISGIIDKIRPGEQGNEDVADAIWDHLVERYVGENNLKRTFVEDPAGILADVSMILTAGGSGLARVPGLAGRGSRVARAAEGAGRFVEGMGRAVDPYNMAAFVPKKAASIGSRAIGGHLTGQGFDNLTTAYNIGARSAEGGTARDISSDFVRSMNRTIPSSETVQLARDQLDLLRTEALDEFRLGNLANPSRVRVPPGEYTRRANQIFKRARDVVKSINPNVPDVPVMEEVESVIGRLRHQWARVASARTQPVSAGAKGAAMTRVTPLNLMKFRAMVTNMRRNYRGSSPPNTVIHRMFDDVQDAIDDVLRTYDEPFFHRVEDLLRAERVYDEIEKTLALNPDAPLDVSLRRMHAALSTAAREYQVDALQNLGSAQLEARLTGDLFSEARPHGSPFQNMATRLFGMPVAGAATALATSGGDFNSAAFGAAGGLGLGILSSTPRFSGGVAHGFAGKLAGAWDRPGSALIGAPADLLRSGVDRLPVSPTTAGMSDALRRFSDSGFVRGRYPAALLSSRVGAAGRSSAELDEEARRLRAQLLSESP